MSVRFLVVGPQRMWTWCRNNRLASVLLVVIALQSLVIARAHYLLHKREVFDDAERFLVELLQKHRELRASRLK
jgi:hypothetical protein